MTPGPVRTATRALQIPRGGAEPRMVTLPVPSHAPDEVLVRCTAVGICGSDLDLLDGTRPPGFARYPVVPGHEITAEVVRAPAATGLAPGQPVAVAGMRWCGRCARCSDGRENLCASGYAELGFTEPGGLAGYLSVPAAHVYPLPEGVDAVAGVLLEPAAVMCLALSALPPLGAGRVAVVGDGTLGLLGLQVLRAAGAAHVSVFGRDDGRLALARDLGADETVRVESPHTPGSPGASSDPDGEPFDVVVEAAGSPEAVSQALRAARPGGHVVLTGVAGAHSSVPSDLLVVRHLTVSGSVGSVPASWRTALRLVTEGRLRMAPLVGGCFPLSRAADAFAAARAAGCGPAGGVKTVITHAESEPLSKESP